MNTTGVEITAGLGGFLVLFALAMALWLLGRDLSRRLRRIRQAEELSRSMDQPGGERRSDPDGGGAVDRQ